MSVPVWLLSSAYILFKMSGWNVDIWQAARQKTGFYEYALRVTENIGKRIKAQTQWILCISFKSVWARSTFLVGIIIAFQCFSGSPFFMHIHSSPSINSTTLVRMRQNFYVIAADVHFCDLKYALWMEFIGATLEKRTILYRIVTPL